MTVAPRPSPTSCFRIADGRFDLMSGFGAALFGARWNPPGVEVVYAASTYPEAILELLVSCGRASVPEPHVYVTITIPEGVPVAEFEDADAPNWVLDQVASREVGATWAREGRSVALSVPGIVARPYQRNVILNPAHPDFRSLIVSEPRPVEWDSRLFGSR